ncbi:IPT/TIG domain-containing protein [Chloroflexota bacterium]
MKYTKIFRILIVALILVLLVAIIPAVPALAQTIILTPTSGTIGTAVYISGSNFLPATTVYVFFNFQPVSSFQTGTGTFFTPFTIPASVTPGLHTVTIQTTSTHTPLNILATSFFNVTARQITISPTSGNVGSTVTVSGSGFNPSSIVNINFNDSPVRTVSTTAFGDFSGATFIIPASYRGTHAVKGRDAGGDSPSVTFTTLQDITVTPASGAIGDQVTITGTGFASVSNIALFWDGALISGSTNTNTNGSFTISTFTIPASSRGNHSLQAKDTSNNQGTASLTTEQSMVISPTSGTGGTEVTISGTGFKANAVMTVTFDSVEVTTIPASVTTDSKGSFSASFNIPETGSGSHEVVASDDTNWDNQAFTTSATLNPLSSLEGYVGTEFTVSGTGFQASWPITITLYDDNVATGTTKNDGSFSISFIVPALATGTYKVEVSDGINTKEDYLDILILTSADISPITGHVGTEITTSGVGFIANGTVTITYDSTQVATATVNTNGIFSTTFTAPASPSGNHTITATDLTTTKQFNFLMESTPPSVSMPLKPEMDMDIEAEAAAYFDWEEVSDPSGVTYTLQIATDENFTEGSMVFKKTGLTKSEYTITEEEKLEPLSEEAPYYWRIKAVDSAFNEGDWSSTGSFYITTTGFTLALPQSIIYTLFGVGALLLGILGFWLGRKTAYY